MKKDKTLVPATEAAAEMEISISSLYGYMIAGKFESAVKRFGTRWFLEQWEIDQFKRNEIDVSGSYSQYE